MKFEIEGTVIQVMDTKQVSASFSKREFVVEVQDGKYAQVLLFETTGKTMDALDAVRPGDTVHVTFGVRGRKYEKAGQDTRYYTSLNAWRVDPLGERRSAGGQGAPPSTRMNESDGYNQDDSDIPFITCDIALDSSPIAKVLR